MEGVASGSPRTVRLALVSLIFKHFLELPRSYEDDCGQGGTNLQRHCGRGIVLKCLMFRKSTKDLFGYSPVTVNMSMGDADIERKREIERERERKKERERE